MAQAPPQEDAGGAVLAWPSDTLLPAAMAQYIPAPKCLLRLLCARSCTEADAMRNEPVWVGTQRPVLPFCRVPGGLGGRALS